MAPVRFPLPLDIPRSKHSCWLTSLTRYDKREDAYTYELTFVEDKYKHVYAFIKVPRKYIAPNILKDFSHQNKIIFTRAQKSLGKATLLHATAEDPPRNIYIRDITVSHANLIFKGEAHFPRSEDLQKDVERETPLPSVEEVPEEAEERRTVEFGRALVKGKMQVEVWAVEGEESWEGEARVVSWERFGDVRRVVVKTHVPEVEEAVLLEGDVTDRMRHGRFVEIEELE